MNPYTTKSNHYYQLSTTNHQLPTLSLLTSHISHLTSSLSSRNTNASVEAFFEGNKGFRSFDAFDLLQFVVEDEAELGNVLAYYFSKDAVIAGCVVHSYDL